MGFFFYCKCNVAERDGSNRTSADTRWSARTICGSPGLRLPPGRPTEAATAAAATSICTTATRRSTLPGMASRPSLPASAYCGGRLPSTGTSSIHSGERSYSVPTLIRTLHSSYIFGLETASSITDSSYVSSCRKSY